MNFDLMKQLSVDSQVSNGDRQLLTKVITQFSSGTMPRVTPQERDRLMSILSKAGGLADNTEPVVKQKEMKDMTEEEKKVYKEELRRRLRNKQNMLKQSRTSKVILEKQYERENNKLQQSSQSSQQPSQQTSGRPGVSMSQLNNILSMINEMNIPIPELNKTVNNVIEKELETSNKEGLPSNKEELDDYIN